MGFIKLSCPNCGAAIELSEDREFGFCTYCGTKVLQDKVVIEHRGKVSVSGVADVQALLDRAILFLEDNQFDKALEYCERILDIDPRNANAYIAKLMSQTHCNQIENLSKCEKPLNKYSSYNRAVRFAPSDMKAKLNACKDQSVLNYQEALKKKNAELDEITRKLRYYSTKSKNAEFWIKNNQLLSGLSIIVMVIVVLGFIIGSKISTARVVFFALSIAMLVITKLKKRNAEMLDVWYKEYQGKASQTLAEYEKWEKWIAQDEV